MAAAFSHRGVPFAGLWILGLIGLVAGPAAGQSASKPAPDELVRHRCQFAYVLLWSKNFDGARDEFRKILDGQPDHHEARLGLGLALERKALADDPPGDLALAMAEFVRIPADSPQYAEAAASRARIFTGQKKFKEAIKLYQELKKKSLLTDAYRLAYVETLAWDTQYEEALKELEPLSKRAQVPPEIAKIEGQILAWSGKTEEALPKLREALKAEPKDNDLRMDLAAALLRAQKQDEAIEVLAGLPEKASRSLKAVTLRTDILTSQRKFDQAIALVREGLKTEPEDEGLNLRLAELLSWTEELDEAINIYRKLLQSSPERHDVRIRLAEALSWAGRFDEAATEFRKALGESNP